MLLCLVYRNPTRKLTPSSLTRIRSEPARNGCSSLDDINTSEVSQLKVEGWKVEAVEDDLPPATC